MTNQNPESIRDPSGKTRPEHIKFKLEMMAMMLMCGRNSEASRLLGHALVLIDQLIDEGVE